MTKIIGIKELQTKTKKIREEVEKGTNFIVIWRSKPIFEIRPLQTVEFANDLKTTGLYKTDFLERIEEAEEDIKAGRMKTFKTTEKFLKSLS